MTINIFQNLKKENSQTGSVAIMVLAVMVLFFGVFLFLHKFQPGPNENVPKISSNDLNTFPEYNESRLTFSEVDMDNNQVLASWTSDNSIQQIYDWYVTELMNNGWQITEESSSFEYTKWLSAHKDGVTADLNFDQEQSQEEGEVVDTPVIVNLVLW